MTSASYRDKEAIEMRETVRSISMKCPEVSGINILYCLRLTISDYHSHSNATELLQQSTIKAKNAHFISIVL